ncbi:flagellar motor protein MotA [Hansschlegelia beijingensis]|uniref:Membrane associated rhomboid family serine protease n=1 Tax=Hansschlegelia beijingensis TaxID=1133344 RepID=A0A7W6CZU8_9HYPH|nr:flagellar motor protein MotA [Hansschlegelia beijingensis]MBB3971472.1 membrane associated rhomboid family serine protease [Hansschlegelia beijingensis]
MSLSELDPYKLSSPRVFLLRMVIFLALAGFVALILNQQIKRAFLSNPGLNGLIFAVLVIGVLLAFRQVIRLFPEVRWVNGFRMSEPGLALREQPRLLAPMASLLGDRLGNAPIGTALMRSILDSIGTRLDEAREIGRYLTGLLVFLGLLGTFWGLLETVGSISNVISTLGGNGTEDTAALFEELKSGLAGPLAGMGTSFSASLFGLSGSLILGFLDLQAGQAQNRFHNELEDWLAAVVSADLDDEASPVGSPGTRDPAELIASLERLNKTLSESGTKTAAQATAHLAEGIQGLVKHMRSEQQMIRDWVEAQSNQQGDLKALLERLLEQRARAEP